jgi:hypothetical protein
MKLAAMLSLVVTAELNCHIWMPLIRTLRKNGHYHFAKLTGRSAYALADLTAIFSPYSGQIIICFSPYHAHAN